MKKLIIHYLFYLVFYSLSWQVYAAKDIKIIWTGDSVTDDISNPIKSWTKKIT
jgi:hypothetical protein